MEKMASGMGRMALNPNAAEFVPAALKSNSIAVESSSVGVNKQVHNSRVLSRNDSDDERRQYWKDQLPDNIFPDFSVDSELNDDRFSWQHDHTKESGEDEDPLEILVNQFPGFGAQSLADILWANGGDLMLTYEMLTQLELQDEVGQARQSQPQIHSHTGNINLSDFPALAASEISNGISQSDRERNSQHFQRALSVEDLFTIRPYSGGGFRGGAIDFAAVVRRNTAAPSAQWERERSTQTERLSHTGEFPAKSGEKLGNGSSRSRQSTPRWLETGETVSNMYTDLREEARDHARVRNAYFEQATQAYLSGNKALAKDLAEKGHLHNSMMKDAHGKAGEAIFQQRNTSIIGGFSNGQPQLVDLHGLHVNEAIPVLKRELAALRATARASHQRLQVLICVGTGHHTKGSRTPARLPIAVEKFLAEDEQLSFTEQQPGMLVVVVS